MVTREDIDSCQGQAGRFKLRELTHELLKERRAALERAEAYSGMSAKMADYISAWANFSNGEPEAKKLLEEYRRLLSTKGEAGERHEI